MKRARDEKGVALVLVLLLAAVALASIGGLLYMLARGGFLSGQQKRYATALEAAKGGADVALQVIADRGGTDNTLYTNFVLGPNLATKLSNRTSAWGGGVDNTTTIDPSNANSYDIRFDLGGTNGTYRVFAKIVDTVEGNSGADTGLLNKGVVNSGMAEVTVVNVPYLYTIEELAESTANPSERAKLSIVYQY